MVPRPVPGYPPNALIPDFYAGRSVFITGATGFMGKVLVERLLWTCRDIQTLYLLMRRKKEVAPEKRLALLKQSQVFDVIRECCPHQLEKLKIVAGDVTLPGLGLDADSLNSLREVSVVFHSAATVKFDEPLDVAVSQNLRSIITLMDICDQLQNIEVLVHVSTAYSNAELSRVEERVYPTSTSVDSVLALVDTVPTDLLAEITPRLIRPKPNTYTFTKALAESAVSQRAARAHYGVAIYRPSIVVSSLRHPFPGWIENMNGPSGVVAGVGAGLLHVLRADGAMRADMIPVDIAIDTLIAVAWDTANQQSGSARVYNCSSYEHPTTWGAFRNSMLRNVREHPFSSAVWYPCGFTVSNSVAHTVCETVFQTIPLHIADFVCKLCCFKTRISLSTASKRFHAMNEAFKFFSTREWHFDTNNVKALKQRLSVPDRQLYNLDTASIDWEEHCVNFVKGTREYLVQEKDQNIEKARNRILKLHIIHQAVLCGLTMLLYRLAARSLPAIWRMVSTIIRQMRDQNL